MELFWVATTIYSIWWHIQYTSNNKIMQEIFAFYFKLGKNIDFHMPFKKKFGIYYWKKNKQEQRGLPKQSVYLWL